VVNHLRAALPLGSWRNVSRVLALAPIELHQGFPDNHQDKADYCFGSDSGISERVRWTCCDALNHVDHLRLAAEADPSSAQLKQQ
jgi:hypothetical protein